MRMDGRRGIGASRAFVRTLTLLIAAAGLAGLAGCAPARVEPLVSGAPRAIPVAKSHDFGEVPPGTRVEHRFEIVNRGDRVLEIEPAGASCGCRASLTAADTVFPGETGAVTVTLDAEPPSGRRQAWIRVETNDPLERELHLVLHGRVAGDVLVKPDLLYLGRIGPDEKGAGTVEVELTSPSVGISSVRASSERLQVRAERLAEPARGVRLFVVLPPQGVRGRINDRIVIETTSKTQPEVEIQVLASVD
jgi:hypothetical protein